MTSPSSGFRNKSNLFCKLTYITKQAKYQMGDVWKGGRGSVKIVK
jgi:hypothetical protein